jgi:hypothetical protein
MDHMSKHTGPWSMRNNVITDAHGEVVADDCNLVDTIDEQGNLLVSSDEARRLILAAPELLAFVLKLRGRDLDAESDGNSLNDERDTIIASIEKGTT